MNLTSGSTNSTGRGAALIFLALTISSALSAKEVVVADAAALRAAIASAIPGDRIVVMPGEYRLAKQVIRNGGAPGNPITVTALVPARTRLITSAVELFKLRAAYWVFEKLTFKGTAQTHHAFHIVGGGHRTVLRGNRFLDFHAAIKGNPERGRAADHVVIERNIFLNDAPRKTTQPVTPIDVLGGIGWILRENFFADFAKAGGNGISYGAFLKGGSRDGVMERNLVVCEWRHSGGRRVGLSFGGGGSPRKLRAADNTEHDGGVIRNNIIINCPNAPGIYLNRSSNSRISNNTLFDSYGIMARFPVGISTIRNNIVSGTVTERGGARTIAGSNLTTGLGVGTYIPGGASRLIHRISDYHVKYPNLFDASDIGWAQDAIRGIASWLGQSVVGRGSSAFRDWFAAPEVADFGLVSGNDFIAKGDPQPGVKDDFCGRPRGDKSVDLGAIEYRAGACDVKAWIADLFRPFE
ncbi:MAG: NosD domain-containing protein [Alphaproteobacteria bacterium]